MEACFKDVSFWTGKDFHENDFFEYVRGKAGDLAEVYHFFGSSNTLRMSLL